jgi:tripartite-type tricarboxylate transporter receptor subunit TctC
VPAVGDFVAGYDASTWQGIGAPKNTPIEIIDKLHGEINAGLADPGVKAGVANIGYSVLAGSTADFGQLIAENTERWAKVIRAANIKVE